jgi:long-chain acyl-CoA synthetase
MKFIKLKQWVAISLLLGCGLAAQAAEVEGVKLPDTLRLDGGPELVLNGAGVRTRLVFRVYVGALYVTKKTSNAAAILGDPGPKRIALHMLRELSADQFAGALEDGLKANHGADELARLDARVRQLRAIFDALKVAKSGDVIHIDYTPAAGTRIAVNAAAQGIIPGEDFHRALLRVWLGDKPADADLKRGLLGG